MGDLFASIDDCDLKIKQLEASLSEAKAHRDIIAKDIVGSRIRGQIAIYLHKNLCPVCGKAECAWPYEQNLNGTHDWTQPEHKRWLYKADSLLVILDSETLRKVINIIKKY